MKLAAAVSFFGSQGKLASALGIKRQAVTHWKLKDRVPLARAHELEVLTGGKLKVDPALYRPAVPRPRPRKRRARA